MDVPIRELPPPSARGSHLLKIAMPKVDETVVSTLSERIEGLPERSALSAYEVVKRLAPAIEAARARGQDVQAIANILEQTGVRLKGVTLRNYLWRAARECELSLNKGRPPQPALPSAAACERAPAPAAPSSVLQRTHRGAASFATNRGRFELVPDKDL